MSMSATCKFDRQADGQMNRKIKSTFSGCSSVYIENYTIMYLQYTYMSIHIKYLLSFRNIVTAKYVIF